MERNTTKRTQEPGSGHTSIDMPCYMLHDELNEMLQQMHQKSTQINELGSVNSGTTVTQTLARQNPKQMPFFQCGAFFLCVGITD